MKKAFPTIFFVALTNGVGYAIYKFRYKLLPDVNFVEHLDGLGAAMASYATAMMALVFALIVILSSLDNDNIKNLGRMVTSKQHTPFIFRFSRAWNYSSIFLVVLVEYKIIFHSIFSISFWDNNIPPNNPHCISDSYVIHPKLMCDHFSLIIIQFLPLSSLYLSV